MGYYCHKGDKNHVVAKMVHGIFSGYSCSTIYHVTLLYGCDKKSIAYSWEFHKLFMEKALFSIFWCIHGIMNYNVIAISWLSELVVIMYPYAYSSIVHHSSFSFPDIINLSKKYMKLCSDYSERYSANENGTCSFDPWQITFGMLYISISLVIKIVSHILYVGCVLLLWCIHLGVITYTQNPTFVLHLPQTSLPLQLTLCL